MNIVIFILLIFSAVGFLDKIFHLQWGLSESFDRGLLTMGSMALSIVGVCSVGVTFIQNHIDIIIHVSSFLPIDPSLMIGALLAPDMGGFSMIQQITQSPDILVLNGVILSSLLGQTLSFQFPVFLSAIPKNEHAHLMRGFIIGIIIVPIGLLCAGILLRMSISSFLYQWIPILLICCLIAICIFRFPHRTIQCFRYLATIIQWLTYFMFFIAVVGIFLPQYAYAKTTLVTDAIITSFRISIIVSGSLVLSEIILKKLKKQIHYFAQKLQINDISMMGLILSCATSLAIFPLYQRMDSKGKILNAAFAVSGAYFLGGQLGFISSMCNHNIVMIYILTKIICGLLSVLIMSLLYEKITKKQSLQ